jgi:hypothetical protein
MTVQAAIPFPEGDYARSSNILLAYSQGQLGRDAAIGLLGLRDYASLLVALGDAGVAMKLPSEAVIGEQAALFVRLWNEA